MTQPLLIVPSPGATWTECTQAAMYRAVRRDVRRAAVVGARTTGLDPTDCVIGCTIAALVEAGWLHIPDHPERNPQ